MKGLAVDQNGVLSIQELDIPSIGPYQALVKMVSCGVCNGTDLKLIHRNFKNFDSYPAILGHEAVGEVVKLGERVTSFALGDRVLLPFLEEPQNGFYPGWGGYAEYAVVGDAQAMLDDGKGDGDPTFPESYYAQTKIPNDFDPVKSAIIVTFREVLSAIYRFGLKANEPVLIYGAGPVGLCFVKFCKLLGLSPVIAVEINDTKAAEAKKLGADYVFNSKKVDVVAEVRKLFPDGIENIVDAVGINELINQAMQLVKYNGKICCYGISPETSMHLDWGGAAPYNWSLLFVQWPSKKEEGAVHNQVINWMQAGALDMDDFISDIVPFENILDAFDKVMNGSTNKKIIIRYTGV